MFFSPGETANHCEFVAVKSYWKFLSFSLARGTWSRYVSALKLWKKFAIQKNIDWKSFPEAEIVEFICWCGDEGNLKVGTIKTYLGMFMASS
jgi:hypothetical protein